VPIEEAVKQNTGDIRAIEGRLGKVEVMHGRLFERVEGFATLTKTQHQATQAGIDDIKQAILDQKQEAARYRKEKEALEKEERGVLFAMQKARIDDEIDKREERQKWWHWVRSTLDGRTILILLAILLALFAPDAFRQVSGMISAAPMPPAIDIAP